MSEPNRIEIIFDGGIASVYGDIFADMLTCYSLALYDRQKKAKAELAGIDLGDPDRRTLFDAASYNYDDAESRLQIVSEVEKVFKNRNGSPIKYSQERS